MLKIVELMPTAFGRSSLPTISTTNDCRIGVSTAAISAERRREHQHLPVLHDAERRRAGRATSATTASAGLRREQQSSLVAAVGDARRPTGPSTSDGPNCSAVTMPSAVPEFVSSRTSQSCATRCIQVPVSETSWPERVQPVVAHPQRPEHPGLAGSCSSLRPRTGRSRYRRHSSASLSSTGMTLRRASALVGGQLGQRAGSARRRASGAPSRAASRPASVIDDDRLAPVGRVRLAAHQARAPPDWPAPSSSTAAGPARTRRVRPRSSARSCTACPSPTAGSASPTCRRAGCG